MSFSPDTVFISYSRSDGREFAEAFERRLEAEGLHAWRDLKSMEAGDIRPQVLRAIESVRHLVLILSRRALTSDWIKREWSHARRVGKRVSPVLADPSITRSDLPLWMSREEVFDIDPARDRDEERWKALVLVLRGDGETNHAPYMPGDLSADFVPRPVEYTALKTAVLSETPNKAVTVIGAGGYGKTMLINALCRDPDVRFEFSDGIMRVDIGKERADVTGLVSDLIEELDPKGKRPGFTDVVTASEHLGGLIGESRLLMVIDDAWREAQLRPFLRGGPNCVQLVTTRLPHVFPDDVPHTEVRIDEMRAAEAVSLISMNLPIAGELGSTARLAALAARLGNWAQMLSVANGWIRNRIKKGERVADSIARFERRLAKDGPFVFNAKDETQRNRAIRVCIDASVEDLDASDATRFGDLAVLPEDERVPLGIVETLWAETGQFDEGETEDLLGWLHALSLLQNLDLGERTLRLHDNILWYLRDRVGAEGCRATHKSVVAALGKQCDRHWDMLPADNQYGWRYLIKHLRGAGLETDADRLRTDYPWIKAKLRASSARELYDSYLPESQHEGARLVGRAIALSVPTLTASPRELPRQLFGRLGGIAQQAAAAIVTSAQQDVDFRPAPRWPGLTPPGAERLRLIGHQGPVRSAAFSPDEARIVTTSLDGTARLWDTTTGQEIIALRGHDGWVLSAAFSPDGAHIVTASVDGTARLWDTATGQEITALRGHDGSVQSAAFSSDGARIVTTAGDGTARLWDATTGQEIIALRVHNSSVQSAAFSPDGARIVTTSLDGTARLWDATTGQEIIALRGHTGWVQSAAFSPDGARIVTTSVDGKARLWDAATGQEIVALHVSSVQSAAFSPNGTRIVTTADDGTARLWDATTGQEIVALRVPNSWVGSAAFSPDGTRIVTTSADRTARLWDATTGQEIVALRGHDNEMLSVAFSPDGTRIVTASHDGTARLWDATTGQEFTAPRGHDGSVRSVSFSPDGTRIVTASVDGTARLWDATTGQEIIALRGHNGWMETAAFSPDGARIVTASHDGTARLWDATTGQEIVALRGHNSWVLSAAFSPDGARIVTTSVDRTARLWDTTTGKELRVHNSSVLSAAFSPDGAHIVTASVDGTVRLWDTATGQEITALRGHDGSVQSAAFSLDGARIVTVSNDGTARLWDATTGQEIIALRVHNSSVLSAAFSPDGARIVTTSLDGTARFWDASTGQEIIALRGHNGWVQSAAFSPDGARIVTTSVDRTARFWDASTGQEITQIVLDASVTGLSVHGATIALGDALGRIHVFDCEEFLAAKG